MGFDVLGAALNTLAGVTENTPSGLDTPLPFGTGVQSFGALGAFAEKIDRSAQRQYIETGIIRNIRPRNMELLMQEPDITVLVKKRQFSSLSENYRQDLMNYDEKLFVRASKILFYNKCRAIAAYERLTKIERVIINSDGIINDTALPLIFSAVDTLNAFSPGFFSSQTQATIDTIRKVKAFSDPNYITTWLVDPSVPYSSDLGQGTGVFELTTVQNVTCTNSVKFMAGSAELSIEDPYRLMIITNEDIDKAIAGAANFFTNNAFFSLTRSTLEQTVATLKQQLSDLRFERNASPIRFLINQNSLLYKKVRAIIDEDGTEINFTYDGGFAGIGSSAALDASARQGPNGLTDEESAIFEQIISNTYLLLGAEQTTTNQILEFNTSTNYVRQRMRLEFGNKPIIQPMDVVHVFISTKTTQDSMLTQGLDINFAADSILGKLNETIGNLTNAISDLASAFSGGSGASSYVEQEKNSIAGPDFPLWLWNTMRNDFTRQAAGTHVFAGIVETGSHSYESGRYTLRVSCKDNANYFSLGRINVNPSVDVYNGSLYDPLTPFNIQFDASSGIIRGGYPPLLDENVRLLLSGSAKAKLGRFRGSILNEDSYKILDAEKMASKLFRRKLSDPDGFVYRWKRGIGSLTLFGEAQNPDIFANDRSPVLTNDPFAGQDVMNVLSLLVTGQPYNFNNFVKAAVMSGTLNRDDLFNQSASSSFFKGLIGDISKNNASWGNFMPFKKMVINESGYRFLQSGEFDITTANRRVTELLKERAKRFDELTSILPEFANSPQFYKVGTGTPIIVDPSTAGAIDINTLSTLGADIINLDAQIQAQTTVFQNSLQNANIRSTDGTLRIFGDDISFDPTVAINSSLTPDQLAKEKSDFRKKINNLTQRRLWKVKANEDINLFIIDDSYDKNYDIQGFERSLSGGLQLFNSTYAKTSDTISGVAQILGLEIFADSQGHIQARPPQYNRMPSSVFYDMIQNKKTKGIQIFPDYLESLFINQVDGLTNRLEIIEDEIRIRAAALGYTTDSDAATLLRGAVSGVGALSDTSFTFVTDENTGLIGGTDIRALLVQATPEVTEANLTQALSVLTGALTVPFSKTAVNFDVIQRVNIINNTGFGGVEPDINNAIAKIGLRLEQKSGNPAPTKQTLLSHDSVISGRSQLDLLNLTQQISQFLSERQSVIKLLSNAVKNLNQGVALDSDPDASTNILFPFLGQTKSDVFPEILEHMLEDDSYDDLGVGSGQRFIVKDSRIISLSITESPPEWVEAKVKGELEGGLVQGPSGLAIGDGGNGMSSAAAVDYDMWRLYGFRGSHTAAVPFLQDPEGQCAPYAVFLLNKARKEIFKGNMTCVGNEFIQCGEVYYIEDRDLLFYAESVTHTFNYGSQYTTSMNLTYGHNPGEYIPSMLDIIGKGLYTNRHQSNLVRHARHGNGNAETPLTILVNDPTIAAGGQALEQLLAGAYGKLNKNNLVNVSNAASGLLAPTLYGDQISLEFRVYYNSSAGFASADSNLMNLANSVLDWLKNPSKTADNNDGKTIIPDNAINPDVNFENVSVVAVDIGKSDETRSSPSTQAWNVARSLVLSGGMPISVTPVADPSTANQTQLAEQEMKSLFTNVIDVWATFAPPETGVTQTTNALDPPTNQSDQAQTAKYISDFNKRLGKE